MRVSPTAIVSTLGLALAACGATSSSTTTTTTTQVNVTNVTNNVYVAWGEQGQTEEVDFSDPRLARAVNETAQLVGHPVQFHFNVAMMPRPTKWFFDALFERYIGRIPRDLEELKGRDADAFEHGRAHLEQIHFDYDGSVREMEIRLDVDRKILRVRMGDQGNLIPTNTMSYAFEEAYEARLREMFDGRTAESVGSDAYRDYFRYLDDIGYRGDQEKRAAALRDMIVLWERTSGGPAELHAATTAWIAEETDFFRNAYHHHADDIAGYAESSPWFAAERAFAGFVNHGWPSLTDQQRRKVLEQMYVRRMGDGREDDPFLRNTFPGIDLFALSMDVVDRWIRAGKPKPYPVHDDDHTNRLFDFVVCAPRAHDGRMYQRARCDSELYRYASTDAALRERLLDEVLRRGDVELTEALFANLKWLSSPYVLDAWRFFESDARQWGIASRVLAELMDHSRQNLRNEMYDDAARLWRQDPAKRVAILYVLASMEDPRSAYTNIVRWNDFSRTFGPPASRRDLDAFLAYGEGALVRVSAIVPALAPGVNVADALAPHLDGAMGDDSIRRRHSYFPHQVLRDLVEALREKNDNASLGRLRAFLEARIRQHPSEQRALETLLQMTRR
jgi:hypothetical protein